MEKIKKFAKLLHPRFQKLVLDYPVEMKPRWGHGKKANQFLYDIIDRNRNNYKEIINQILSNTETFLSFNYSVKGSEMNEPTWNNQFLPGLDIVALYSIIKNTKPQKYIEIGSGNSTKVARRAIKDSQSGCKIISIDPFPRAEIDHLADQVIRKPLEQIEKISFISDDLNSGDILFIDNSHRVFPNSDVTVCLLELLPALKKGVIVHVHDIYLPYDYPQFMCDRFYSEQYLLAALMMNTNRYKVVFPCYFVSEDKELDSLLTPLWSNEKLDKVEKHGGSFWFEVI